MKIILHKSKFFLVLLLFVFYGNVNAQCTITGATPNASTYNPNPCTLLSSCGGILYIGNGTAATNLIMSTALNLTCLGPIQLIVRSNASIDFSSGNDYLTLATGSSIAFEGTGTLIGGSCNASERIYIGTDLIASCNGNGPGSDYSFPGLIAAGGFNIVNITPASASACGSGSFSFTATAIPSAAATIKWYTVATLGTPFLTGTAGSSSTITPTISNTTTYYAEATIGAYTTPRKAVVATINPLPSAPTVGTITQPTCPVATGSVALSGLPSSGTWTLTRSGTSSGSSTGTGTSTTISGLAVGTYTYTVSNATCTSVASSNVVISSLVTNTWTVAGSWSTGSVPTADQNIVFAGDYNSASDLSACSCQVTSGAVNINAGNTLTLTNGLTVTGGTMILKNQSSLVQINNVANSGNITYIRDISTSIRDTDYTYWSSPVAGFTVGGVSPTTAYFYSYDSSADNWKSEASTTVMTAGKGYIIRGPAPYSGSGPPPPPAVSPFIGVPNNGDIPLLSVTFTNPLNLLPANPNYGVSYLLGNPYPSALDADKFLFANKTVLDGTLYFWTHNTQMGIGVSNPGTGVYAYSQDDYASYNTTGGVGTGNTILGVEQVANKPTGKIAAGQGFFATCIASGTVSFKNSMRVAGNNTQFFRKNNTTAKGSIEKNRVWLNLTNTQGAFKQTLVGYITGATNEYDNAFDGESFDGNEFVDFYSVNQNKNLVIQGRALPFDENDQVALGFRTTINGAFTIKIDQVDGVLANQKVFIEDKLTNTVFDLKSGNYTFNTVAGTFNERFVLRYTDKTLGTNENTTLDNQVLVSNKNKQIRVYSQAESIAKVTIYDLLGRQIYQKEKVNSTELTITSLGVTRQTLIVKTQLQNGQVVTKKVVY